MKPMTTPSDYFREDIKAELRRHALHGGSVRGLMEILHRRLGLATDHVVPILGYLCQAFSVPLRLVLPLRELIASDDSREPYFRALRICFWFSANLQEAIPSASSWDEAKFRELCSHVSHADAINPDLWEVSKETSEGTIRSCQLVSRSIYFEGWLTVPKDVSRDAPADATVLATITSFGLDWRRTIAERTSDISPDVDLGFLFEIEEQRPLFRVQCRVRALASAPTRTLEPVRTS